MQAVALAPQHVAVEPHEEAHLPHAAPPVFRGEGVSGEVGDAEFEAGIDNAEQHRLAAFVPFRARQPAFLRPPAVAVHDQGDVRGQKLIGHRRGG